MYFCVKIYDIPEYHIFLTPLYPDSRNAAEIVDQQAGEGRGLQVMLVLWQEADTTDDEDDASQNIQDLRY